MSDNLKWLSDGIDGSSLMSLSSNSGIMPLATDDPGGDICGGYTGCNLYICLSDGSSGCSSDSSTCSEDEGCQDSATATVRTSVTLDSVTITVSGMSSPTKTRIWQFTTYTSDGTLVTTTTDSNAPGITSITHTITGLTAGTSYYTIIKYGTTKYTYTLNSTPSYTTLAANYTLTFTASTTYNSITMTVTVNTVQSYDLDLAFYLDGSRALEADIAAGSLSRTRTYTTDISPATSYQVSLKDKIRDKTWYLNVRTKNNFSWSTTVASGQRFNLLASDWNNFTSQLKSKEQYYTSTTRTFTSAVKGNIFTAVMFNQAVNAINNIANNSNGGLTTMTKVSTGDNVYAADINKLANCLNE